MAARLEWFGDALRLGGEYGWTLGAIRREGGRYRFVANRLAGCVVEHGTRDMAEAEGEALTIALMKECGIDAEVTDAC